MQCQMLRRLLIAAPLVLAGCGGGGGGDAGSGGTPPPQDLSVDIVSAYPALSFSRPLAYTTAPGDPTRAFVATQAGVIHVFDASGDPQTSTVFLDISDRVSNAAQELGLLGLAFDPNYASNGYFYVNYNPVFDGVVTQRRTAIARFRVSADPALADPTSETVLLSFEQPRDNHNGGWLGFGPDGALYIASGDGGGAGDPDNLAQSLDSLLGKVLRIQADGSIPADNPFVGTAGRDEIWAYGLRNPFRGSFDPATGDLWLADVGQDLREEVNVIARGGNYGWRKYEGTAVQAPNDPEPANPIFPLFEYDHSTNNRCSITGGYVYRGSAIPALAGSYVFADFCSREVWRLDRSTGVARAELLGTVPANPTSFGVDAAGELYITALDGKVYTIEPAP